MLCKRVMLAMLVAVLCGCATAFAPVIARTRVLPRETVTMNAKTPLSANGKRIEVAPGSSMMAACKRLGIKVKTSCKKGDCGTCTVNVGGKSIRACVGKVPPAPKLKSVLEKGLPVKG